MYPAVPHCYLSDMMILSLSLIFSSVFIVELHQIKNVFILVRKDSIHLLLSVNSRYKASLDHGLSPYYLLLVLFLTFSARHIHQWYFVAALSNIIVESLLGFQSVHPIKQFLSVWGILHLSLDSCHEIFMFWFWTQMLLMRPSFSLSPYLYRFCSEKIKRNTG